MPTFWDSSLRFDLLMHEAISEFKGAAMNRLEEKLKVAGGVVARQNAKIEARADAIIAREALIEAKTDQAFLPHEAMLDGQERGLDSLERSLATVSNDPLGSSTGSPQAGQTASLINGSGTPSTEPHQQSDGTLAMAVK